MKTDKIIDLILIAIVALTGYKLMKVFGIIEDTQGAKDEADFNSSSKFLPYRILFDSITLNELLEDLKPSQQVVILTQFSVKDYSPLITQLLGAKKLVNDDETAVYSAFKSIGSLEELAYFVKQWKEYIEDNPVEIRAYYLEYPDDIMNMGNYLSSFLNKRDFTNLKTTLAPLKHYYYE